MTIYFAFSDENGAYKRIRTSSFRRAHPYYVRCSFVLNAEDWKRLDSLYLDLKERYRLPRHEEIKWSYARAIQVLQERSKTPKPSDSFYFLRNYPADQLKEFIAECAGLVNYLSFCKLIFTVTCNSRCQAIEEQRLLKMHLQESMQRIEMDMQSDASNLCVYFVDPVSNDKDKALREAYSELYRNGDLIERYAHIKDSLNIEHSHHSVGIQMADIFAGAFTSNLRGYELGQKIYQESISQVIRRDRFGSVGGYGVREVPGNKDIRQEIIAVCA